MLDDGRAQLEERFAELGEPGRRFLEGLFCRFNATAEDQAQRVLALLGTYAQADLDRGGWNEKLCDMARIPTRPWTASCTSPRPVPEPF